MKSMWTMVENRMFVYEQDASLQLSLSHRSMCVIFMQGTSVFYVKFTFDLWIHLNLWLLSVMCIHTYVFVYVVNLDGSISMHNSIDVLFLNYLKKEFAIGFFHFASIR